MKKLNKYIMLFVAAFALVSCVDDVVDTPTAEAGDEVQFGLSLPSSRTVYGDIASDGKSYPIYWVNNDKVYIFSPECLNGRSAAEYQVSVSGASQNYADALTKTGAYGVQWGTADKANFYSLYPSGQYKLSGDGTKAENIFINYLQNIEVNGDDIKSDMEDCLMYARTANVTKGETVNLTYNPITTTFMIKLQVDGESEEDFTIQSVRLVANENIAGMFSLNVVDGSFAEWSDNKSASVMTQIADKSTGGFYTIGIGENIEIPLFIAPVKGLNTADWKIEVVTDKGSFTKTLPENEVAVGKVHKIALPVLKVEADEVVPWDPATWMKNIPRNVYLSEISIPGSWNSLNPDFQGDNRSIEAQYQAGVRAFHLDTRWKAEYSGWGISTSESKFSNFELSVANGGDTREVGTVLGIGTAPRVMTDDAPTFESYLKEIVANVKPNEYMVVFCSFAQDSYSNDSKTNNMNWMQAVSKACDNINALQDQTYFGKIYNANDPEKKLTANTVVGDVLGKVIVIVNCEKAVANETLPTTSNCMFVNVPNTLTSAYFPTTGFKIDNLYFSNKTSVGISLSLSQAQITGSTQTYSNGSRGYYPSFTERKTVVNAILDWSKENYTNKDGYAHNSWIYLGLGGNTGSSATSTGDKDTSDEVLDELNPIIEDRIDAMGTSTPYYPIGIVYLNYTEPNAYTKKVNNQDETVSSAETVKKILMLNNRYRLQFDPTKPENYNDANFGDNGNMNEE